MGRCGEAIALGDAVSTLARRLPLEHAVLSWDIAAWVSSKLTAFENERVAQSSYDAIAELQAMHLEPSPHVRALAGMPDARTHRALVAGLAPALVVAIAA